MFVDEGFGCFGVCICKFYFRELILRVVDEGIFFDEWDLLLKGGNVSGVLDELDVNFVEFML